MTAVYVRMLEDRKNIGEMGQEKRGDYAIIWEIAQCQNLGSAIVLELLL
jgi:hypothetical protein